MTDKDISMNIKMNQKSFNGIKDLADGKKTDESPIESICRYIDERFDCADFRVLPLLKILYAFSDPLSKETKARIKETLLNFKYWMDEPGDDSMCYWSENHQLLFHTCEYMAGNMFPEDVFTNNGMTGKEHVEKSKWRILQWLEHKWKYGFIEWHSNTYYEEDIAPLAMLIDHSPDAEIAKKAKIIMDVMLLDMAMFSFEGFFSSSSGRCYEGKKKDGTTQCTRDIYEHAFGDGSRKYSYQRISSLFTLCKNYKVPEVLRAIAEDKGTRIIKDSQGLDLSELKYEFEIKEMECAGAFMWQMEAFTNPESIEMTLDMFNKYKMYKNDFIKDLKMINYKILRKLRVLPVLLKIANPSTQGVAIQRSNNYTYKIADYMLSTSMRHHAGEFGDQQHIWHAILPGNTNVFTTHPGVPFFDDQARNFSPDYWVGNGVMPDSVQHENIHMSIYKSDVRKGLLERKRQLYTHAFFPKEKFDEIIIENSTVFGRKSSTYIALISAGPLEWVSEEEAVQKGKVTAWVCHVSSEDKSGSFKDFVKEVNDNGFNFNKMTLSYKKLQLKYKKEYKEDGKVVDTRYLRYDTPYIRADRKPENMEIAFKGKSLVLDFNNMSRIER